MWSASISQRIGMLLLLPPDALSTLCTYFLFQSVHRILLFSYCNTIYGESLQQDSSITVLLPLPLAPAIYFRFNVVGLISFICPANLIIKYQLPYCWLISYYSPISEHLIHPCQPFEFLEISVQSVQQYSKNWMHSNSTERCPSVISARLALVSRLITSMDSLPGSVMYMFLTPSLQLNLQETLVLLQKIFNYRISS